MDWDSCRRNIDWLKMVRKIREPALHPSTSSRFHFSRIQGTLPSMIVIKYHKVLRNLRDLIMRWQRTTYICFSVVPTIKMTRKTFVLFSGKAYLFKLRLPLAPHRRVVGAYWTSTFLIPLLHSNFVHCRRA